MKITIIGTGYVGLVTGASMAALGHKVTCVGRKKDKIDQINSGKSPFFEPGLNNLLVKLTKKGLMVATNNLQESIKSSDFTIIAVGTPTVDNKIDLSEIREASKQIGEALRHIKKYHVVIVKSTVVPGTSEKVVKSILEEYSSKNVGKEFGLCMNPEFLREGSAVNDALHPDRIIIGQYDERSGKTYARLYEEYQCPIVFTNLPTAEMIKYVSNSLLSTLISYSNEIALIAEKTPGVDVVDVWKGIHLDARLSPLVDGKRIVPGILNYLFSGCGFGGSCFPKDTQALLHYAKAIRAETPILKNVIEINKKQPLRLVKFLQQSVGPLANKRIAVLGLTFKPDTDDMRETPALPIIWELIGQEAKVVCHDPQAYQKGIPELLRNLPVVLERRYEDALRDADAMILVTAWNEYGNITPQQLKKLMKQPIVIDGRRIFNKQALLKAGVIYKGIGLG